MGETARVNDYFSLYVFSFVPNFLKFISRHYSFFMYRGSGGATADILHGRAGILSGVPDILHVQRQFFENF